MFLILPPFTRWCRTIHKKGKWYHPVLATALAGIGYGLIMLAAFLFYESSTETKWVNTQELSRHSQTILDLEKGLVKASIVLMLTLLLTNSGTVITQLMI